MTAWVIVDWNGHPIAVRETEQDTVALAERIAKMKVAANPDYGELSAETLRIVPHLKDDSLRIKIYLKGRANFPYMEVWARKFDSDAEPIDP